MGKFKLFFLAVFSSLVLSSQFVVAKQIVIVGDSHAHGYMGQNLQKSLEMQSHKVDRFAVIGSSAKSWLGFLSDMPTFPQIVKDKKPDQVIFSLGTNDIFNQCPKASFSSVHVKKLLDLVPQSIACVWIGPPGYKKGKVTNKCGASYDKLVDDLQKSVVSRCQFIDTRNNSEMLSHPENVEKDTIHVTSVGGVQWSQFVLKQLDTKPIE